MRNEPDPVGTEDASHGTVITLRLASERRHTKKRGLESWKAFQENVPGEQLDQGFGIMRALNEVCIRPGAVLPRAPIYDAELLTYVYAGAVAYQDTLGRAGVIQAGEFHRMATSARTRLGGMNPSRSLPTHIFQIRLGPTEAVLEQRLEQKRFSAAERRGDLRVVASPTAERDSLRLQQDAIVYSSLLDRGQHMVHELRQGRGAWLHVVHGELTLGDILLETGDAASLTDERSVSFTAISTSEVLLLDLPKPSGYTG